MTQTVYIAKALCKIGRETFQAGQVIKGVPEARCKHLLGRLLTTEDAADDDPDVSKMTVPQLVAFAKDLQIDLPDGALKADMVATIEEATK